MSPQALHAPTSSGPPHYMGYNCVAIQVEKGRRAAEEVVALRLKMEEEGEARKRRADADAQTGVTEQEAACARHSKGDGQAPKGQVRAT